MEPESIRSCTLCFNGQHLSVWCPEESYGMDIANLTSRRWIWDRPQWHRDAKLVLKLLGRSSISVLSNGVKTLSLLAGLRFW